MCTFGLFSFVSLLCAIALDKFVYTSTQALKCVAALVDTLTPQLRRHFVVVALFFLSSLTLTQHSSFVRAVSSVNHEFTTKRSFCPCIVCCDGLCLWARCSPGELKWHTTVESIEKIMSNWQSDNQWHFSAHCSHHSVVSSWQKCSIYVWLRSCPNKLEIIW